MQVHPDKVAALPMQQLQTLLQTLEFGLNAPQPEAVQSALEALAALAKFDWQKKSSGQPGLAANPGAHYNILSIPCACRHTLQGSPVDQYSVVETTGGSLQTQDSSLS